MEPAIHSLRFNLPTPKPAIIGVPGAQLVPLGPYGKELRWDPTPDLRTKVGDKVRLDQVPLRAASFAKQPL